MEQYKNGGLKFILGWCVVFAIRLIPFRPANVEPVLATQMPFAKRYGWVGGFLFGFLSIVLFDMAVQKLGIWTLITGVAYGLVGVGAYWYFRRYGASIGHYAAYGIIGTILYDALTGLTVGPIAFHQSFVEAFWGQIPFTARHLLGTIPLSIVISPLVDRWIAGNVRLEVPQLFIKKQPIRT